MSASVTISDVFVEATYEDDLDAGATGAAFVSLVTFDNDAYVVGEATP